MKPACCASIWLSQVFIWFSFFVGFSVQLATFARLSLARVVPSFSGSTFAGHTFADWNWYDVVPLSRVWFHRPCFTRRTEKIMRKRWPHRRTCRQIELLSDVGRELPMNFDWLFQGVRKWERENERTRHPHKPLNCSFRFSLSEFIYGFTCRRFWR